MYSLRFPSLKCLKELWQDKRCKLSDLGVAVNPPRRHLVLSQGSLLAGSKMYAFHVLHTHGLRDYRFSFTVIRTAIGDHTTHTVHTKLATFRFCRGEKKICLLLYLTQLSSFQFSVKLCAHSNCLKQRGAIYYYS